MSSKHSLVLTSVNPNNADTDNTILAVFCIMKIFSSRGYCGDIVRYVCSFFTELTQEIYISSVPVSPIYCVRNNETFINIMDSYDRTLTVSDEDIERIVVSLDTHKSLYSAYYNAFRRLNQCDTYIAGSITEADHSKYSTNAYSHASIELCRLIVNLFDDIIKRYAVFAVKTADKIIHDNRNASHNIRHEGYKAFGSHEFFASELFALITTIGVDNVIKFDDSIFIKDDIHNSPLIHIFKALKAVNGPFFLPVFKEWYDYLNKLRRQANGCEQDD